MMTSRLLMLVALASLGALLCAAEDKQGEAVPAVAETFYRRDHPAPNHDEPKPHYYPPKKDPSSGGYEYRTDAYEGHESDRRDRREEYDHHYEHRSPYGAREHDYEPLVNELTPTGDGPRHLKLRLFGTPVGHSMNMSMATGLEPGEDGARHKPLMKMYDMWCDVPHDSADGDAVPVPHLGHFHVSYKPAHFQKPWRLWGQTALKIGKIDTFTLAHLDDDDDQSVCATIFNNNTVITPLDSTPIYNMLIKPNYPVNMLYVLDDMRAYPIPLLQAAAYSVEPSDNNGETSHTAQATNYDAKAVKSEPTKVIVEESVDCRIAQVIWGRVRINTRVNGRSLVYEGTIRAVPDLDDTGVMSMPMRRSEDTTSQIIEAMCGDEAVKEAVPWAWEFDLKRV